MMQPIDNVPKIQKESRYALCQLLFAKNKTKYSSREILDEINRRDKLGIKAGQKYPYTQAAHNTTPFF